MNCAFNIENLSIGYKSGTDTVSVGVGLSARLIRGKLTCLLGPNGSGKSTLLRTMSGFLSCLEGSVSIGDRQISSIDNSELARLVSIVLTDNSRIGDLKVFDVVSMGRSPYTDFWGRLSSDDSKMVTHCLNLVQMSDYSERRMYTLSDGERQKVMIAKALAQDTDIILLDEPTAFLDYPNKVSMMLLLHTIAKSLNKAVLLSTHDMEHALQIADQIWLLDKSLGMVSGSPQSLIQDGSIERYFATDDLRFDPVTMSFRIMK